MDTEKLGRSDAIQMFEANFRKPMTFDHTLTMEWLNDGQHIEHYRIEAWDGRK